jgi:uncharacterized protein (DUF4415 family)
MSQTLSNPKAKTMTMPNGRVLTLATDDEDAKINAGIAADPDTYELSDAEFKQLRPGRPLGSGKKVQVTLRIDSDVVERFKASGAGWQTRMNDVLKSWSKRHA